MIYFYLFIALILTRLPLTKKYFCTFNTMIHESGHAIGALLMRGKVDSISLFSNTEGVAITRTRSWFGKLFILYSGYTFSTMTAFVCFFLISNGKITLVFYGMALLALCNLLLWVRNSFGITWLLLFLGLFFTIHFFQLTLFQEMLVLFLSSVLFIESFTSTGSLLLLSLKNAKQAGDASSLQRLTFIPAPIWSVLFFSQSLICVYYIYRFFL